ncbi:peptidylprolyl isomerase [Sphingomonas sp. 22176]|uniref:peptidylprolyl isomerase n=1 Tax=Sphingomonas sp. 22176 TaxID=3453884 RepID=UPI003F867A58
MAANPGRYDEYRLIHIFVAVGTTPNGKTRSDADALKLAQGLRLRLARGESFEDLAAAASEDRSTSSNGGHLPATVGVSMNDAFFPYARRLADLAVTEPVRGPRGHHLIRLDQRIPATVAASRYWVEQDVINGRLPEEIRKAVAALPAYVNE